MKILKTLLIGSISALMLLGCNQKSAMQPPRVNHPESISTGRDHPQSRTPLQRVRENTPSQKQAQQNRQQNPQTTAKHLANIATRIPHVKHATAIAAGNYTIVGIDVDSKLDRGRVGSVKYAVAEALKKDPRGAHALVTADADLVQRIRELSDEMAKGKPLSGMMDELADIAGRIAPQSSKGSR